jgi:hypothetical protein
MKTYLTLAFVSFFLMMNTSGNATGSCAYGALPCKIDSDCMKVECINGRVAHRCATSNQCPKPFVCLGGICTIMSPSCKTDKDCFGHKCVNGKCNAPNIVGWTQCIPGTTITNSCMSGVK